MSRCVVIHANGTTELQDFRPAVHQRLRGLGYKRFAIELVRRVDKRRLTAALYSRLTPSEWQVSEAARQLWGRVAGAIRMFDEDGGLVDHRSESVSASPAPTMPDASSKPAPPVSTPEDSLASAHARMRAMDAIAVEHRLRSLAHHWLYLVDRNDGDGGSFDELLAIEFELNWSPSVIRTREDFSAWYRGVSRRVLKSSHSLAGLEYERLDNGRYDVRVELQWYGFTRAQPEHEHEARTLHEWTVADDPSDRFARIERATIEILVPAQPRRR